jgi:hypothetical protein
MFMSITFTVESPDGQRTVTFVGTRTGTDLVFKRTGEVRRGGKSGGKDVFGPGGSKTFNAMKVSNRTTGDASLRVIVLDRATGPPLSDVPVQMTRIDNSHRAVDLFEWIWTIPTPVNRGSPSKTRIASEGHLPVQAAVQ